MDQSFCFGQWSILVQCLLLPRFSPWPHTSFLSPRFVCFSASLERVIHFHHTRIKKNKKLKMHEIQRYHFKVRCVVLGTSHEGKVKGKTNDSFVKDWLNYKMGSPLMIKMDLRSHVGGDWRDENIITITLTLKSYRLYFYNNM